MSWKMILEAGGKLNINFYLKKYIILFKYFIFGCHKFESGKERKYYILSEVGNPLKLGEKSKLLSYHSNYILFESPYQYGNFDTNMGGIIFSRNCRRCGETLCILDMSNMPLHVS